MFGVCLLFVAVAVLSSLWLLCLLCLFFWKKWCFTTAYWMLLFRFAHSIRRKIPPQFASNKKSTGLTLNPGPFEAVNFVWVSRNAGAPCFFVGDVRAWQPALNQQKLQPQCLNANGNGWFQSQQSHNQLSEMRIQVGLDSGILRPRCFNNLFV